MTDVPFSELVGKTITTINGDKGSDELRFCTSEGVWYLMHHDQDCCETVSIEDICGDMSDLLESPILQAEESSSAKDPEGYTVAEDDWRESYTWTFYRLATVKGSVVIRWLGESNGYYSESVDFVRL